MKAIIYKDYRAGLKPAYSYTVVEVKNLCELFFEADRAWHDEDEKLYLIRIMLKRGKVRLENGYKKQLYEAVACKRSNKVGWYANTKENHEDSHWCEREYAKGITTNIYYVPKSYANIKLSEEW